MGPKSEKAVWVAVSVVAWVVASNSEAACCVSGGVGGEGVSIEPVVGGVVV